MSIEQKNEDTALGLIKTLRQSMTRKQLADALAVQTLTVERWETGKVECKPGYIPALKELYYGTTHENGTDFSVIDLLLVLVVFDADLRKLVVMRCTPASGINTPCAHTAQTMGLPMKLMAI
ncbi:hypothetical protein [Bifidobacterium canis]|uniref:hypothetical protein n=1 Tax=Bifidobacterium canis TaxID=2610880 RepID=UPI0024845F3A|nr:hypothetical protein [Bifidobacterium canis]